MRDLLMELLAAALEQGRIGRVLDERVLKHIARLGRQATLKDQFRLDQLLQTVL